MKPLYSKSDFNAAKPKDLLPLQCETCGTTFYKKKTYLKCSLAGNQSGTASFCSSTCHNLHQNQKMQTRCSHCDKQIQLTKAQHRKSKSGRSFCSRSCAATYNNTHKTKGNRRSRLELWLQGKLTSAYPNLEIKYNQKDAINSELDIYIPSLRLAFELNGIFHYEPIYGPAKLASIQNNDGRKFQACIESQIELCIIDSSKMTYFKEDVATQYLTIITNIINSKFPGCGA